MPPPTLGTLYCGISDVASMLGAVGLVLRLDDDGVTTGSITGATNADPIVCTSAAHGLNTGDLIQIKGVQGNTWANGLWVVTYLTSSTFSLQGSDGTAVNAYVASTGTWDGITYPESNWINFAINWATAKVNRFLQTLYDASDLVNSWSVYVWTTTIAAHWFCARRGNPIPGSLNNYYLETLDELMAVKQQEMAIEDIGYRNEVMPTWSNMRMDRRWTIKQYRMESALSGRTKRQFPSKQDFANQIIGPAELNSI